MISPRHKVNLSKPDKVILVEIFQVSRSSHPLKSGINARQIDILQLHFGLSVVDGAEWENLKRYNVNALYELKKPGPKIGSTTSEARDG